MPNENCLEGWTCPSCGKAENFHISGAVLHLDIYLWDTGTEEAETHNTEWQPTCPCRCMSCQHTGVVSDFSPEEAACPES